MTGQEMQVLLARVGFHTLRRTRLTEVATVDFTAATAMLGAPDSATTAKYAAGARGTLDLDGIRRPGATG